MSSEERKKILQMVSDGKITVEEAANLMRALDAPADDELDEMDISEDEIIVNLFD